MEKRTIAVFGGAFNPPTIAHINLAKQIIENCKQIEKVVFVPVSTKYNKSGLASNKVRFEMLKTICEKYNNIEVTDVELKSLKQLYTIETLEIIQKENQNKKIYFILGTDNLKELETWHNVENLLKEFKIIVLERNEDKMEEIIENNTFLKNHKKSFIKIENIDRICLSSSYAREQIKLRKSLKNIIPEEINKTVIKTYKNI